MQYTQNGKQTYYQTIFNIHKSQHIQEAIKQFEIRPHQHHTPKTHMTSCVYITQLYTLSLNTNIIPHVWIELANIVPIPNQTNNISYRPISVFSTLARTRTYFHTYQTSFHKLLHNTVIEKNTPLTQHYTT